MSDGRRDPTYNRVLRSLDIPLMINKPVKKSPVFPAGKQWEAKPDAKLYESEVTAMVRSMRSDPSINEDQEWAHLEQMEK